IRIGDRDGRILNTVDGEEPRAAREVVVVSAGVLAGTGASTRRITRCGELGAEFRIRVTLDFAIGDRLLAAWYAATRGAKVSRASRGDLHLLEEHMAHVGLWPRRIVDVACDDVADVADSEQSRHPGRQLLERDAVQVRMVPEQAR